MGKGDKRTRRGKIFNRSYGKSRLQNKARVLNKTSPSAKKKTK
ncbi:MAG: 30S ribosomal protein THX [Proteobacteria bacterium]|nr:30S ribosomal protein THX [Pseudomonadota bacterium]